MASIKHLKKDINYLAYELLTEAFAYRYFHPDMAENKFFDIISQIVSIRNDLISRVNNRETDNVNVHAYFGKVRNDMVQLIDVMNNLTGE